MSAVVITRTIPVPRGATTVERWSIRLGAALTAWATTRAEARQERRERMLQQIQATQTARHDTRYIEHLLAQQGLPRR